MNDVADAPHYADHVRTLCHRADVALARSHYDHLVISSGYPQYRLLDDQTYPYIPHPFFASWVPMDQSPGSWLVYTPGQQPELIIYQPQDYWHAPATVPNPSVCACYKIHLVQTPEHAFALLPKPTERCAIIGQADSRSGQYQPNNPSLVMRYLEYYRAYKTLYEQYILRQAQNAAVRGHRVAAKAFYAGKSSFEIYMAYCTAVGQEPSRFPYTPIIAMQSSAAILHYTQFPHLQNTKHTNLLIDAGASVHGYAADISRSYAIDPTSTFAALITAVENVQHTLCKAIQPGYSYIQLQTDAALALMHVLKDAGVLKVSAETALATGIAQVFFPHGIGHLIGIQVHDVGGHARNHEGTVLPPPNTYPSLRLTRTLEPSMVVTVEPGLYFIDILLQHARQSKYAGSIDWSCVASFQPYGGIRIEDTLMCGDKGPENLTRQAFASYDANISPSG